MINEDVINDITLFLSIKIADKPDLRKWQMELEYKNYYIISSTLLFYIPNRFPKAKPIKTKK